MVLSMTIFTACSDNDSVVPEEKPAVPETGTLLTVELGSMVTRAQYGVDGTHTWEKGDTLVVQGNVNSTFQLVSGEGTSIGKFRGELPPTSTDTYIVFFDNTSSENGVQTESGSTKHLHTNMISDLLTPENLQSENTIKLFSHNSYIQMEIASVPQGFKNIEGIQIIFERKEKKDYETETETFVRFKESVSTFPYTANFSMINNYKFTADRVSIIFYGGEQTFGYTTTLKGDTLESATTYKLPVSADELESWKELQEPFMKVIMNKSVQSIDLRAIDDIVPRFNPMTGYWEYRGVKGQVTNEVPIAALNDVYGIEKVIISEGVSSIGDYAFLSCYRMAHIELPSTLKTIYDGAFLNCYALSKIKLPADLEFIDESVFAGDSLLTDIQIPQKIKVISEDTFSSCTALKSITLPEALESIEGCAFKNSGLTSIVLPEATKNVADDAFKKCAQLESITVKGILNKDFKGFTGVDTQKIHLKLNSKWNLESGNRKPSIDEKKWMDAEWASIEWID